MVDSWLCSFFPAAHTLFVERNSAPFRTAPNSERSRSSVLLYERKLPRIEQRPIHVLNPIPLRFGVRCRRRTRANRLHFALGWHAGEHREEQILRDLLRAEFRVEHLLD